MSSDVSPYTSIPFLCHLVIFYFWLAEIFIHWLEVHGATFPVSEAAAITERAVVKDTLV